MRPSDDDDDGVELTRWEAIMASGLLAWVFALALLPVGAVLIPVVGGRLPLSCTWFS